MRDICGLRHSSSNHLVNLLSHSLNVQRRCFRRLLMFLCAQLMLRICTVEASVIRCEFFLWPRLMVSAYASHRLRSFSNPTSSLGCAGHMPFLKSNPTSRIFSDPGSTFPTPGQLKPVAGVLRRAAARTLRSQPRLTPKGLREGVNPEGLSDAGTSEN
jgi:hypothetical protein